MSGTTMSKRKHFIKHSILTQVAFTFIGLMAATLFACWLINSTFLQSYYERNRKDDLITGYNQIASAIKSGKTGDSSFSDQLLELHNRANISGIILDADSEVLYYFGNDSDTLDRRVREYLYGTPIRENEIIEQTEEYLLLKIVDDSAEYMEMHAVIGVGTVVMLRTPLANVTDSVKLANRFLVYVGMIAIVISSIVIWMVTKKITGPVLQLADISRRMAGLDFDVKYEGKEQTEISLLGDNINKLSKTLEKTISELKTANNELQSDIIKKNKIDQMRKEFLANVSHELKTPIALIQGYAEGLQENINDDPENRKFYCDVIMDEAAKMNTMVKKLMTLNQMEFGTDVVTMERIDVVDLICNCIQSAQILTRQNGISVRMEHYDPIYVWADEFQTEEVFMNYFSNAVNHASGEKIIDVKLTMLEKKVRISVFNTGDPIPEESIGHIWEKFYKVDKSRSREYGGSGVGLSIVQIAMESMNQEYGVINYENGVEFWFELETAGKEG